jgi:hypothetical protein
VDGRSAPAGGDLLLSEAGTHHISADGRRI